MTSHRRNETPKALGRCLPLRVIETMFPSASLAGNKATLHVTVSRAIGCRFLSCVVVTSPTVITCSNGLTEEALWEGVLLPALLPACSLRSVFFSGRWPGPVGSFRSTAPHHNPPFLELATTSSPCQAMKLCESASNVELPLKPKSCWFQTELDDLDT